MLVLEVGPKLEAAYRGLSLRPVHNQSNAAGNVPHCISVLEKYINNEL